MFAINHAAAALLLKKHYDDVPMPMLLVSVQAVEFGWVGLNYLGIERTTTEHTVRFVGDIHLSHMPYSHSVFGVFVVAAVVWGICSWLGKRRMGVALTLGVLSHLALDLLTHTNDIALAPFFNKYHLGLGLYASMPITAFLLEMGFGLLCWWYFRGSGKLLATIVLFNLANVTMFTPDVIGLEGFLAHRPMIITSLIAIQIVVTLVLVGIFSRPRKEVVAEEALGYGVAMYRKVK